MLKEDQQVQPDRKAGVETTASQAAAPYSAHQIRAIRDAVAAIVQSPDFVRSGRIVRFLTVVVDQSLRESGELSERHIAQLVFDRDSAWDPKLDPIVRIEARRLRSKLESFYQRFGPLQKVLLSIPKGGYRVSFEFLETSTPVAGPLPASPSEPTTDLADSAPQERVGRTYIPLQLLLLNAAGYLIFCLLAAWLISHKPLHSLDRPLALDAIAVTPETQGDTDGVVFSGKIADEVRHLQGQTRLTWNHVRVEDEWSKKSASSFLGRVGSKIGSLAALDPFTSSIQVRGSLSTIDRKHHLYLTLDGASSRSFESEGVDNQTLIRQAAEYLYSESQPIAYSVFLNEQHRYDEAVDFSSRKLVSAVRPADRLQLLFSWANALASLGHTEEAISKAQLCLSIDPQSWSSYTLLSELYMDLGRSEQAFATGLLLEQKAHRSSWMPRPILSLISRPTRPDIFLSMDYMRRDFGAMRRAYDAEIQSTSGEGSFVERLEAEYADVLIQLHERSLAMTETEVAERQALSPPVQGQLLLARIDLAQEKQDLHQLTTSLQGNRDDLLSRMLTTLGADDRCKLAVAFQQVNDPAAADTLMKDSSPSADCTVSHARILALRGQHAVANSMFETAVTAAPRLPSPHFYYGEFLLASGSTEQAKQQFQLAHELGPHWAEPSEALARVRASEGDPNGALQAMQEACKAAPAWALCHLDLADLLQRAGRTRDARSELDTLGMLDPTTAELSRADGIRARLR